MQMLCCLIPSCIFHPSSRQLSRLALGSLLWLTMALPRTVYGDEQLIDSLTTALEQLNPDHGSYHQDTTRINLLLDLGKALFYHDRGKALANWQQALALSEQVRFKKGAADALINIGFLHRKQGAIETALSHYRKALTIYKGLENKGRMASALNNIGLIYKTSGAIDKALEHYEKSLEIRRSLGDQKGIAISLNNLGVIYRNQGNISKALDYYQQSLKIRESLGDDKGIALSLHNIGSTYQRQGDLDKALEYHLKALAIREASGTKQSIAQSMENIGLIRQQQGKLEEALEHYRQSLIIQENIGNKSGVGRASHNIGSIYRTLGDFNAALLHYRKSQKIWEETNDKQGMAVSLNGQGKLMLNQGNYDQALAVSLRSLKLSQELGYPEQIKEASRVISEIYLAQKQYKEAFRYYREFTAMKDSILNEENTKILTQREMEYAFARQQQEQRLEQEKKDAVAAQKAREQRTLLWSVTSGLGLFVLFSIFLYNRLRFIRTQKQIIESQKKVVDKKNQDITDSINYAQRIQHAILRSDDYLKETLDDHFVLFKPKDVVSGDFYWANKTAKGPPAGRGGTIIWAAADCTGHGVPGALMSMIGNSLLNEIVIERGITRANVILDELRAGIIKTLQQQEQNPDSRDGMDIAICCWDKAPPDGGGRVGKLSFAGAYNPLYLVRRQIGHNRLTEHEAIRYHGNDLVEIKGDRQTIAFDDRKHRPFTPHTFDLQQGDLLYTFSDGYPDQFGGEDNRKFNVRRFRELLLDIADKPMASQKAILDTTIESWKAGNEDLQIDDICVIGVRI